MRSKGMRQRDNLRVESQLRSAQDVCIHYTHMGLQETSYLMRVVLVLGLLGFCFLG
jgi:hypothetical protein